MAMVRDGWAPPTKHRCDLPDLHPSIVPGVALGSVWQCDDCPRQWIAVISDHGHLRWRRKWLRIDAPHVTPLNPKDGY